MARLGTKPNGIHYLDVHVAGEGGKLQRQRVSTDTRDRAEAEKQRKEWIAGVHPKHPSMGGSVAPKGRVGALLASSDVKVRTTGWTVERLLDRCYKDPNVWGESKSLPTLRSNIKFIVDLIGDEPIASITRKRLKELVVELSEGLKPATIKRKLDTLSRALREAVEEYEDEDGNPLLAAKPTMPKITFKNERSRILEHHEEPLVFAAIDARIAKEPSRQWARFRMLIRVLLDTGFRKSEATLLGPHSVKQVRVAEVGWRPFLALPQYLTKNDEPRMVPATQAIIDLIPALDAQAVGGLWFPSVGTAWYMWDTIRSDVKAGGGDIDEITLHTLRHTCITRLGLGGMELQRLSIWAGHSDVSITAKKYSHLGAGALYGGVETLAHNPAPPANSVSDPELSAKPDDQEASGNRANRGTPDLQLVA
nr:tyrosine-type recombinase/integrase [uncultured Sphingomonas sp.]